MADELLPNYLTKLLRLQEKDPVPPGAIEDVQIMHGDWCAALVQGWPMRLRP